MLTLFLNVKINYLHKLKLYNIAHRLFSINIYKMMYIN